jgi:uncharacterized membrane protein HdeD (DUF308 family)
MNIVDRAKAPVPKFFKIIRSIGLVLATIGGTIMTAPIALPAVIVTVGGYLTLAGGIVSAVSQLTVDTEERKADDSIEAVNDFDDE